MRLRDVMNRPAITCPVTGTLDHAARLMWEYDCGIIPVLDDRGGLAGVVTDRDICMAAYTQGRALHEIPVTTAMAHGVVAAHTEDLVEHAEELMAANQIRRVPVLDGENRVAGVVSMNDLARLAAKTRKTAVDREIVKTLSAICEPRAIHDGEIRGGLTLVSAGE